MSVNYLLHLMHDVTVDYFVLSFASDRVSRIHSTSDVGWSYRHTTSALFLPLSKITCTIPLFI